MLDHLSIQCADVEASQAFYDAVLEPLGGGRVMEFGGVVGYGVGREAVVLDRAARRGAPESPNREVHVAFVASDRAAVRAFFEAAVAAGAEVLHEPRLWPEYHPRTTARSCAIRTATTSRPSATRPKADRTGRPLPGLPGSSTPRGP